MVRIWNILLVVFVLASGCATERNSAEQRPQNVNALTGSQVQRYLNSYTAVYTMASAHWAKRRYTPPDRMLAPQGTLERAIEEMRAGGKLPEFERLLQSYGFDSAASWQRMGERIAYAYMTLRQESLDPARLNLQRQAQDKQLAMLAERRATLLEQGDDASRSELKNLEILQKEAERRLLADVDAEVLRPHFAQLEELNKQVIRRER